MNEAVLRIEGLEKSFGNLEVLKGIDLTIHKGEVVCVIGASGSGKSTLLRCVNLLEEADAGRICASISTPCARRSAWCSRASTFSATKTYSTTAPSRP